MTYEIEQKHRAGRNRTIALDEAQQVAFLGNCVSVNERVLDCRGILDKTIHGDSLAVLPCLPKRFVDLLIVDPPYNLSKMYGTSAFKKMNLQEYEGYTRQWIEAVIPLLKPTASVYVCCDWRTSMVIGSVLADYFHIQNRITWQREKGRGAMSNWKNGMEDIWFATVSADFAFNLDAGDIVLDPFLGSGTTSVVARKLGRHFVGIEQEALYCALAEKRLELALTDKSIQGYTDGVFWERNSLSEQKKAVKKIAPIELQLF